MSSPESATATWMHRSDAPSSLPAPSARVERLREALLTERAGICLERPELWREFERSSQGKAVSKRHPAERRAWALRYVLTHRRPRVYEDELIVGNMSSRRIGANYYPEGASVNIIQDLHRLENRSIPLDLTAEEKLRLVRVAIWGARRSIGVRALARPGRLTHLVRLFKPVRYLVTEEAGVSHFAGGYEELVRHGLRRADQRARAAIASGRLEDGSRADADALALFRSVRVAIDGLRHMARRIAEECERQARRSDISPQRSLELLRAADACRRVPFEPARTFQEALQSCWLMHIAYNMEDYEQGLSFGRLDQVLWPLYQRDRELGRIDEATAIELIASFQLKTCETIPLFSESVDLGFSGNTVGQAITLGGVDTQGRDVTNALSGMFLDAFAQLRTREPNMQVRVHAGSPTWFLDKASELLQLGCGQPALYGDAVIIRALREAGMSTAHARDYAIVGCVEMASPGRTYNSSDAAQFNLALCLELALNRGHRFDGAFYSGRLGAATPPVSEMRCLDDLFAAFTTQIEDAVEEMAEVMAWLEECYREHRTTPFASMTIDGCLQRGRDVTWGGALYDMTSIQAVGLADVGDSLAAIDELVFRDGSYTLPEVVDILRNDFEGQAALQTRLRTRFAHYGSGDARADAMTRRVADAFVDVIAARRNTRGGQWLAGFYTMTCHTSFGKVTGALPSGRLAGTRLSNGYSPVDGADVAGPTALLRSAASLHQHRWANGGALNLKFDARTVEGPVGRRAMADLFSHYLVDQHGMQLQINVLDADLLRAAKADPDAYPGLLVRVSGYCAYFRDLQPEVQNEIIERTAHGFG